MTNVKTYIERIMKEQEAKGYEYFDCDDIIWATDKEQYLSAMKNLGIKSFTVSNVKGNLLDFLAFFQSNGYNLKGVTQVINRYAFSNSESHRNAFLLACESTTPT